MRILHQVMFVVAVVASIAHSGSVLADSIHTALANGGVTFHSEQSIALKRRVTPAWSINDYVRNFQDDHRATGVSSSRAVAVMPEGGNGGWQDVLGDPAKL